MCQKWDLFIALFEIKNKINEIELNEVSAEIKENKLKAV